MIFHLYINQTQKLLIESLPKFKYFQVLKMALTYQCFCSKIKLSKKIVKNLTF